MDPIPGGPGNPQSWNRYSYVLGSPITLFDPTGLKDSFECKQDDRGNTHCERVSDSIPQPWYPIPHIPTAAIRVTRTSTISPHLLDLLTQQKGPCPLTVPEAPKDADLRANMAEAHFRANPLWFYNQVKPGGPWDYKIQNGKYEPRYEDFGNFNYGATGYIIGFPLDVLRRMPGFFQENQQPHWNSPFGKWPHGNQPRDQGQTESGIAYVKICGYS